MVMDSRDEPLNDFDWQCLGLRPHQGIRLNIPMPRTRQELRTLAFGLAKLSDEFHKLAGKEFAETRPSIREAAGLVRHLHKTWLGLGSDWEREYQELQDANSTVVDMKEHSGDVVRTRFVRE